MERRNSHRVPCRWPVRVLPEQGDQEIGSFFLDSIDITPDGVFLEADLLFPVGEALSLEFEVPGRSAVVRGRAEVVRVVAEQEEYGMGLRLFDLGDEERRALSRMSSDFVRSATPPAEA